MKKLDGGPALLFTKVDGFDLPVIGNLLSCQASCEAAFGIDFNGIRAFVGRALGAPTWCWWSGRRRSSTSTPRTSTFRACCPRCITRRRMRDALLPRGS